MLNQQVTESPNYHPRGMVNVFKIWHTFQGEGPYQGHPSIFIRLAGCNLQCPACFGVAVKGRIPYLTKSFGPSTRLDRVREGDVLLTYDKDFNLVETTVTKTLQRKVDEWLEIQIDGMKYDVTHDHPFFTTRGLLSAAELKVGDFILDCRPEEVIAFKKKGDRNPIHRLEVMKKKLRNTDYKRMGKKVSKTIREKQKKRKYKHPTERMTQEEYDSYCHKIAFSKRREKNPNWKGHQPNLLDLMEAIKSGDITRCQKCKRTRKLLVHHHDEDHTNDNKSNLKVWCHQCHNQHHQRGYNFWNGKRKDGKELISKHNGQKVEKITKCNGELPVFNISCSPHPTYLANGMWVHNCDTDYTSENKLCNPGLIVQKCNELAKSQQANLVVITGGEPFRQNITPLVKQLFLSGYDVQVETNGTLFIEDFPYSKVAIVCSPKTPKISAQLEPHIDYWKYVLDATHVNPKDGLPTSVLGMPWEPARRHPNSDAPIYVQPMDSQNEEETEKNVQATIKSCLTYNYRICLQIHKLLGLE